VLKHQYERVESKILRGCYIHDISVIGVVVIVMDKYLDQSNNSAIQNMRYS
jgi:hypothetical protein